MEAGLTTRRGYCSKCMTLRRALILASGYTFFCLIWISLYYNGLNVNSNYAYDTSLDERASRMSYRSRIYASSNVQASTQLPENISTFQRLIYSYSRKGSIRGKEKSDVSNKTQGLKSSIPPKEEKRNHKIKRSILEPNSSSLPFSSYRLFKTNKYTSFHCKTCALVSSSGQLLHRHGGEEIDSHDCVIRMNDAPTKGFEADVGKRTTVRIVGHTNIPRSFGKDEELSERLFGDHEQYTEKVVVHFFHLTNVEGLKEVDMIKEFAIKYPRTEFTYFTSDKMKFSEKLFLQETGITRAQAHTWFSTGWFAMLYAIDTCESIHVYGMVYENYCREHPKEKVPYHYYDPTFKTECDYYQSSEVKLNSGHLFITEKALFARWSNMYDIQFHYPRWRLRDLIPSKSLYTPFLQRYKIANDRLLTPHPWWKLFFHFSGLFYPLVH